MCKQDEELERLHELFASVGGRSRPEPDISAREWLQQEGASERMLAVADACYANDFGCSLHQLGLSEMITENQRWDSGAQRHPENELIHYCTPCVLSSRDA